MKLNLLYTAIRLRAWPEFAHFHCTCAETSIILLPVTNQTAPGLSDPEM